MILEGLVKLYEIRAPSPDADDETFVFFGMCLGVEEGIAVDGVELELMTAALDEIADEGSNLRAVFIGGEQSGIKFERQGTAVADLGEVGFRIGTDDCHGIVQLCEQGGGVVRGKRLVVAASVGRCADGFRVPQIEHCGARAGTPDAAAFVGLAFQRTGERFRQPDHFGVCFVVSGTGFRRFVAQEVEELIAEYAGDYLDDAKAELGENAGAAELALKAREILEKDVEDYFGYSFAQWLEEVTASYKETALAERRQEEFGKTVTISAEQVKAWFEQSLADQKETFASSYSAFKSALNDYQAGETDVAPLYTPEGFGQIQVISFDVDQENSATYAANELEMTELEAEYGKLVLRGENEARQAEILTRYGELKTQNDALLQKDLEKGENARTDALNGKAFTEIFNTYSNLEGGMTYYGYDENNAKRDGTSLFYTKEQDTDWPEQVWKVACALKEGEISELLQVGDSFYLIKRLGDLEERAAAFEDDTAAYTAAALADRQAEEWDAVQEDWITEARTAAVFYEDNYAGVGL